MKIRLLENYGCTVQRIILPKLFICTNEKKIDNLKNFCNTKIEMLLNFDIFTQAIRIKSSCTDIYKKWKWYEYNQLIALITPKTVTDLNLREDGTVYTFCKYKDQINSNFENFTGSTGLASIKIKEVLM